MPAHNQEGEDSVFEEYTEDGRKPALHKGAVPLKQKKLNSGRNSLPSDVLEGKDRRLSSGSESGSKEHTWLRLKKRKEKQIISTSKDIAEEEREGNSGVDKVSKGFFKFPKSTSTLAVGPAEKNRYSESNRKAKSFSNLQESDDCLEVDENVTQTVSESWNSHPPDTQSPGVVTPIHHDREILSVSLHKPKQGGLGFSVVGLRSDHKVGTFVQEIQPGGVAYRCVHSPTVLVNPHTCIQIYVPMYVCCTVEPLYKGYIGTR